MPIYWDLFPAATSFKSFLTPVMHATRRRSDFFILCILGSLSVVSPFAIDMYLPAIPQMAKDFGTTSAEVTLSVSSYFIGLALGQVFYGPLLDRFGRKPPLLIGLAVFILASVGCLMSHGITSLVAFRFLQALGGCAAQVAAIAMVHDFFPVSKSAKIFSLLFLFIGASPLFAPSIGSMMMVAVGWKWIFIMLAAIVFAIFMLIVFLLPEGHVPDPSISLGIRPIFRSYLSIIRYPSFYTYTFAGAFSFAGLFTYVAGSPIIFLDGFHVSAQAYGAIFALLAAGFIGGSQFNVFLLRHFSSSYIFVRTLSLQVIVGILFFAGNFYGLYGLYATLALFFAFLACAGISNPNASALALAPFSKNAGSASALMGFFQLGTGAFISTGIGLVSSSNSTSIILIMAATSCIGLVILLLGRRRIIAEPLLDAEAA